MPRKARANYFNFSGGLDTDNSPLNRSPITIVDGDNIKVNIDGSAESRRGMEVTLAPTLVGDSGFYVGSEVVVDGGTRHQLSLYKSEISVTDGYASDIGATPDRSFTYTNAGDGRAYIPFDGKYVVGGYQQTSASPDLNGQTFISFIDPTDGSTTNLDAYVRWELEATAAPPSTTLTWQAAVATIGVHPFSTSQTDWTSGSYTGVPDYSFGSSYAVADQVRAISGVIELATSLVTTPSYGKSTKISVLEKGMPIKVVNDSGSHFDTIKEVYDNGAGKYIIILDNLSETVGMSGISTYERREMIAGYPTALTPALGRIFMSTSVFPNRLYYSQIYTDDITKAANFHTEANPIDPIDNEVVASDGGYTDIKGIAKILHIGEINGSIIVFADNGVWELVGSDGLFRADDFVARRISKKGLVGVGGVAELEDGIAYVSKDGVNYVFKSPDSGILLQIKSLTDNKIHELIKDIPQFNVSKIRIKYNDVDKELYLMYPSIINDTGYDKVLTYSMRLNAWIPSYSLTASAVNVGMRIKDIYNATYDQGSGDLVKVPYVVYGYYDSGYKVGYGRLITTDEYDFVDTDYEQQNIATFSSAHQTHGDLMRGKNANYIKVLYEDLGTTTTDDNGYDIPMGGCKLRCSIDFANNPLEVIDAFGQPKYTNVAYGVPYEVYHPAKSGFSHHMFKHKVLGRGNALQYHFSNYLTVRWWVAVQNSTVESPVLDDGTYWTETTEAAYDADGNGEEWAIGTAYTTGDYVKTSKLSHFKIVGWACELIPTEGNTNY